MSRAGRQAMRLTTKLRRALRRWRRVPSDKRCAISVRLLEAQRGAKDHEERNALAVALSLLDAADLIVLDLAIEEYEAAQEADAAAPEQP